MPEFNKLVRDRIPEIIRANGREAITSILSDDEYIEELKKKLKEEVEEFMQDETLEELADVLEVVYAIAEATGSDKKELEKVREKKASQRGGFKDRIFLYKTNS